MSDVLVLNADAQPLNYLPLSAVTWREAIQNIWLEKCTVLEYYDDWVVSSPSAEFQVPAIIMMKDFFFLWTPAIFYRSSINTKFAAGGVNLFYF